MIGHGVRGIVLVAILLAAASLPRFPVAAATTIGPGVFFEPAESWASLSFSSAQSFSSPVSLDAFGVTFDNIRLGVAKAPAALPRLAMVITVWSPLQTVSNATVLRFSGDAPAGSSAVVTLSNVIPAREYVLQVDGAEDARMFSDITGFVSFMWSSFSVHDFHLLLGWRAGLPPSSFPLSVNFTFGPPSPGVGETTVFSATAAGGTSPYHLAWDFGDGFAAAGPTVSHGYARAGTFSVTLAAYDVGGRTASATKSITVRDVAPPPSLSVDFVYAPPSPRVGDATTFSAVASGSTPPYDLAWDFGDGSLAVGDTATHVYAAAGTFVVTLTAGDAAGGSTSVQHSVTVQPAGPPPSLKNVTAAFDYTVDRWTVTFADRSRSASGRPITSLFWAFGDGTSSRAVAPVHAYSVSGFASTYTVVLVACDSAGECGATAREITLYDWSLVAIVAIAAVGAAMVPAIVLLRRTRRRRRARRENAARERKGS